MSDEEFDFSTSQGAAVAEEANKGGDFQREIQFLTLKADPASVSQGLDQTFIRLLTENVVQPWMAESQQKFGANRWNFSWITVKQHYAKTKAKPPYASEKATWPARMYAVCRNDKVFSAKFNHHCPLDAEDKPKDRTWALAVEREQVRDDQGKVIGMRDKTREVFDRDEKGDLIVESTDADGKKHYKKKTVPAWLVLNFGWRNFFGNLNGQASWHQTVLDRDYVVIRKGMEANDTNYTFIPLDPAPLGDNPWGVDPTSKYDMGLIVSTTEQGRPVPLMEAIYGEDMPDIRKLISERTSEDYYGRWFTPGWLPKDFDPSKVSGAAGDTQGYRPQGGYQPPQAGAYQAPQGGSWGGQQAQTSASSAGQVQQPPAAQPQTPAAPASDSPPEGALNALKDRVLSGQQPPAQN